MVFENHSIMYHPPQQGKTHIHTAKEKGEGSAPSVSVTGARNDKGKERIQSLLEEIWQDDSWLPAA